MRLTFKLFLLGFLLTGCITSQPVSVSTPTTYKPIIPTATAIATYTNTLAPTTTPTVIPPEITINSNDNQVYLEGFSSYIKSLAWSKDGKTLIIGDTYNGIVFFDVENKNITINPVTPIWEIALSPDKTTLSVNYGNVIFASSSRVSFVNLETGKIGKTIGVEKAIDFLDTDGKTHIVNISTGAIFAPDGKIFILNNGTQVTLWDIASGNQIKELFKSEPNFEVLRLFLNPAKDMLLAIYHSIVDVKGSERILIWDTNTWKLILTKKIDRDTFWRLSTLSFSPDGNSFATINGSDLQDIQEINIWNFNTFTKSISITNLDKSLDGLHGAYSVIVYDSSGKYVATGGNGNINIYNANTGKLMLHLVTDFRECVLAFSPDGTKLAVGGTGKIKEVHGTGKVMIWNWNQP